jgi:subtilisin
MEGLAFVTWLQQNMDSAIKGRKRHIVRIADAANYRSITRALSRTSRNGKRKLGIEQLPCIHGLLYYGNACAALMKRYASEISIEEDVKLSVHGLPLVSESIRSIRVPAVRKFATGAHVSIGIIDTGADYSHPDLQPVLFRGINLLSPRFLPYDDNGHGTHIAGTIAAAGRMTGIAPKAALYPVKAFDHRGAAYVSDIIKGIEWCVQHKVDVINMSFGMKTRSDAMLDAVRHATKAGIVIVASAGNDGERRIDYPARFLHTISVGALNRQGRVAAFSNTGQRIDVLAPGERIVSTWPNRRYHELSGTSMATSHVTGVVALLKSVKPRLTPNQLKRIITAAQTPVRGGLKRTRSPGQVDAVLAFRQLRD